MYCLFVCERHVRADCFWMYQINLLHDCHLMILLEIVFFVNIYCYVVFFLKIQTKCYRKFEFLFFHSSFHSSKPNTGMEPTRSTFLHLLNTGTEPTHSSGMEPFHSVTVGSSTKHTARFQNHRTATTTVKTSRRRAVVAAPLLEPT